MARLKVIVSYELPSGDRCVDIFKRLDGTFGFEEYRRDAEDPGGWFAPGVFSDQIFDLESAAEDAATQQVAWLPELIASRSLSH